MSTYDIDAVNVAGLAEVAKFYETVGYGGGVFQANTTLAIRLDGRLLGAVRLCTEGGVIVLRGMQVATDFRGKGVGHALLTHCVPYLDKNTAYCLPYEHLTRFYGRVGFVLAPPGLLPKFLAERLAGYVSMNRKTVAMCRMPQ